MTDQKKKSRGRKKPEVYCFKPIDDGSDFNYSIELARDFEGKFGFVIPLSILHCNKSNNSREIQVPRSSKKTSLKINNMVAMEKNLPFAHADNERVDASDDSPSGGENISATVVLCVDNSSNKRNQRAKTDLIVITSEEMRIELARGMYSADCTQRKEQMLSKISEQLRMRGKHLTSPVLLVFPKFKLNGEKSGKNYILDHDGSAVVWLKTGNSRITRIGVLVSLCPQDKKYYPRLPSNTIGPSYDSLGANDTPSELGGSDNERAANMRQVLPIVEQSMENCKFQKDHRAAAIIAHKICLNEESVRKTRAEGKVSHWPTLPDDRKLRRKDSRGTQNVAKETAPLSAVSPQNSSGMMRSGSITQMQMHQQQMMLMQHFQMQQLMFQTPNGRSMPLQNEPRMVTPSPMQHMSGCEETNAPTTPHVMSTTERLKILKENYEQNLITEDEYTSSKSAVLRQITGRGEV